MKSILDILPDDKPLLETFKPEDWLLTREVADIFGVKSGTIAKWLRAGKFDEVRKVYTPTYQARFYRPDVLELYQRHENYDSDQS